MGRPIAETPAVVLSRDPYKRRSCELVLTISAEQEVFVVVLGEHLGCFVIPELPLDFQTNRNLLVRLVKRQLRTKTQVVHAIVDVATFNITRTTVIRIVVDLIMLRDLEGTVDLPLSRTFLAGVLAAETQFVQILVGVFQILVLVVAAR